MSISYIILYYIITIILACRVLDECVGVVTAFVVHVFVLFWEKRKQSNFALKVNDDKCTTKI